MMPDLNCKETKLEAIQSAGTCLRLAGSGPYVLLDEDRAALHRIGVFLARLADREDLIPPPAGPIEADPEVPGAPP